MRRLSSTASLDYIENAASDRVETRHVDGEFAIEFQNTDRTAIAYSGNFEFLPAPFRIAPGVTLPVGGYSFDSIRATQTLGRQRPVSGTVTVEHGTFYNGHRTGVVLSASRVNLSPRVSIEPSYTVNWVDLVQGDFTTHLLGTRATFTMTPLMFSSALVQYNSSTHAVSANVRLRWEYRPGSEMFVVYNEERSTRATAPSQLSNRALIVKVNRLVRF